MSEITYNQIFMGIIFTIGLVLTTVAWDIESKLEKKNCLSSSLKTSTKLCLMIGVIFITSSISFFGCSYKCGSVMGGYSIGVYIITLFVLGIILIVLGSLISASSSTENCESNSSYSSIWAIGVFMVLTCLIYLGF